MKADKQNKPWSLGWMAISAMSFGPGAASLVVWRNLLKIGRAEEAKKFLIVSLSLFLIMGVLVSYLPLEGALRYIPRAIGFGLIIWFNAKYLRNKAVNTKGLDLSLFAWSTLGFVLSVLIVLAIGLIDPFIKKQFPFQHANDQSYLEAQCKYFDSVAIQNSNFYIPEDATCFINSNLPQYRLDQIYETINLATNLERERGITSAVIPKVTEKVKEYTVHNTDEYIQYIYEKNKNALTKEQINEILSAEVNYAKLIGITK